MFETELFDTICNAQDYVFESDGSMTARIKLYDPLADK